jgi:hypothetical protein
MSIRMNVASGMAWYGDPAPLKGMFILAMAAASAHLQSSILLNESDRVADFHRLFLMHSGSALYNPYTAAGSAIATGMVFAASV